jgi:hypothetical protein
LALLKGAGDARYWPTHGTTVTKPDEFVDALIAHRHHRTEQIVELLRVTPQTVEALVTSIYVGLDERLTKAAGRSVLAHLIELERLGNLSTDGTTYTLA